MGRSTKKGPWVEERLMGRIVSMNEAGSRPSNSIRPASTVAILLVRISDGAGRPASP